VKEQRDELRFSISSALMGKLNEAQNVISSKYPQGVPLEDVLEEALEVLLKKRSPNRREKRRTKRKLRKLHPLAGVVLTTQRTCSLCAVSIICFSRSRTMDETVWRL
jgi:hypothetical protein